MVVVVVVETLCNRRLHTSQFSTADGLAAVL
jgi:hypothetical protein